MAICNGDTYVEVIEATECIGNSLVKINSNYEALDKVACKTSSVTDALLAIDGIVISDGEGNLREGEPGRDFYYPGDSFDWNVTIEGTATIYNNVTLTGGANLSLLNGNVTCKDVFAAALNAQKLNCSGEGFIGGKLNVSGTSNFADHVDMKSMKTTLGAEIGGELTAKTLVVTGALSVGGIITAKGDITANFTSDERLKTNIKSISNALEKVNSLRGVEFDWNTELQSVHQGKDTGVIAQDVEKVMPTAVVDRDTGYKGVKYDRLIPLLIEAVKELTEQNVALKAEIEALKSK